MRKWLRRIRGAVGMGLTWAAGWSPIGAVIGLVMGVVFIGPGVGLAGVVARYVGLFATLGFFGGAIFSTVLRITEGRRRFDELSLPRFAAWGGLGGFLLGVLAITGGILGLGGLTPVTAIVAGAATLLGAGSAAGSLALARRAHDQELLEAGADIADAGLTEKETHELLGSTG